MILKGYREQDGDENTTSGEVDDQPCIITLTDSW